MIRPTCCKRATAYICWGFNYSDETDGWILVVQEPRGHQIIAQTIEACPFCGRELPRLVDR